MITLLSSFMLLMAIGDDQSNNWPDFRGGIRGGVVEDKRLPDTWSTTKNVLWKTDLPGKGWSSPIVWDNSVFLTSVVSEGKKEEVKKGLYFGGERQQAFGRGPSLDGLLPRLGHREDSLGTRSV